MRKNISIWRGWSNVPLSEVNTSMTGGWWGVWPGLGPVGLLSSISKVVKLSVNEHQLTAIKISLQMLLQIFLIHKMEFKSTFCTQAMLLQPHTLP